VGSTSKRRTTRAKLNREAKLRDKRVDKQARKAARRLSGVTDQMVPLSGPAEPGSASDAFDSDGRGGAEAELAADTSERERPGK
jgi:hypothetical protein